MNRVVGIRGDGRGFDDLSFMVLTPGDEFCVSATEWNWSSVFIPNALLAEWSGTPAALESSCSFNRNDNRAERFRSAVERLALIVREEPAAFDSSAALNSTARKLEHAHL